MVGVYLAAEFWFSFDEREGLVCVLVLEVEGGVGS